MNFFTIVAKLGFEGLDLVFEDKTDGLEDLTTSAFEEDEDEEFNLGCLFSCSVDEDGSEKWYKKRKKGSQHFLIRSLFVEEFKW